MNSSPADPPRPSDSIPGEPRLAPPITNRRGQDVIGPAWKPGEAPVPFFEAPGGAHPVSRRMLLVFFGFAPSAAVGPQRWKRLGDFAAERGWQIDVLTLHPDELDETDLSRLEDLAPGMRLFGFRVGESLLQRVTTLVWAAARPLIRRLRNRELRREASAAPAPATSSASAGAPSAPARPGSLALRPFRIHATILDHLDNRRLAMKAAELGCALARAHQYDLVVSSGPPHAGHDAGRRIALAMQLPLVMDLRDAWVHERLVVPHKLDPALWRTLHGAVERRCLEAASLVLCTTEPMRAALVQGFPSQATRILTIRNGADRESLPRPRRDPRFVIAYAGNLYAGRDPRLLFRAVRRLARERELTAADIGVEFAGGSEIEGTSITSIAREEGIPDLVRVHGQRTRMQALEFLASATMLLSLPQQDTFAIPAKLYEYVQFEAWLLALSPTGSATAQLLAGSGADVVDPEDVDAIAAVVAKRFDEYRSGVMPRSINADGRFDRRVQAEALFQALDRSLAR